MKRCQHSRKIYIMFLVVILLSSACTGNETPVSERRTEQLEAINFSPTGEAVRQVPQEPEVPSPTVRPSPTASPQPTLLPTATPLPSATFTPEPTPSATSTPLPTPTATPEVTGLKPGFYPLGGCAMVTGIFDVEWCIIQVEVLKNGNMVFTVTWRLVELYLPGEVWKRSDVGNKEMNLTDNLGNTIYAVEVGGDAAIRLRMIKDVTLTGYFVFPPALPGANIFTFHDDNNGLEIKAMYFDEPIISDGYLTLHLYPYSMTYKLSAWSVDQDENGYALLNHNKAAGCQLVEWTPNTPQGKYKNTIEIGLYTYEIYGWTEPDQDRSVREYLLVSGMEELAPEARPMFRAIIPNQQMNQCLMDVAAALGALE